MHALVKTGLVTGLGATTLGAAAGTFLATEGAKPPVLPVPLVDGTITPSLAMMPYYLPGLGLGMLATELAHARGGATGGAIALGFGAAAVTGIGAGLGIRGLKAAVDGS